MEDAHRRPIEAILFDLDGTLLDTSDDFVHTLNTMLVEDGYPPLPAALIRSHVSDGSGAMVTLGYSSGPDQLEPMRQRFLNTYHQHISQPDRSTCAQLFDGMDELLTAIEANHIPWGIVTNKPRHLAEPVLHQLHLAQRYGVLLCPEDVTHSKPAPESLWLAAERLDCTPKNCLYIGDHQRDIQAGLAAGMTTFAALYGFIPDDENPNDWHADYAIASPHDLLAWLNKQAWQLPGN